MGPQASARLYEMLIENTQKYTPALVDADYPEIVLLNIPVPNFISDSTNMPEAIKMLINRTKILENAGCVVNGIACNTAHILLPELQAATQIPFISIPVLAANIIKKQDMKRVGLLATPTTLASALCDEVVAKNTVIVRPAKSMVMEIEVYIYKQLNNNLSGEDRFQFTQLVDKFTADNDLEAIILGCTELPLIYQKSGRSQTIDTLELLALALLENYYEYKLRYNRGDNE